METTNPNYALQRKQELLSTMQQLTNEQSLDGLLFCIVDIINETNTCFVIDEQSQDIVRKAFDVSTVDNVADL
ncbi:hypothetical protein GW750_03135 [bacterium]|nr:hypothetical protein [bacterium]